MKLRWLETQGGHIIVLAGLVLVGVGMVAASLPHADEILVGAFAALLALLRPNNK